MSVFIGQNLLVRLVIDASVMITLQNYNRPDSELQYEHQCYNKYLKTNNKNKNKTFAMYMEVTNDVE